MTKIKKDQIGYQVEYPLTELEEIINFVCDDWNVPKIRAIYNPRLNRFYGKYVQEFFCGSLVKEKIEISKSKIFKYRFLYYVAAHELAHYIQVKLYGFTDHGSDFQDLNKSIRESILKDRIMEG